MDMKWIYAMILIISQAWSQEPGIRNVSFNQGSAVNLTCSNKTWKDTMFVTWEINKQCRIAFLPGGESVDTCNDGKSLRNTSSFQSYLHIPKFSKKDEGVYKCESPYKGGIEYVIYHVAMTVPPYVSMWLEPKNNNVVAVCTAKGGNPAANISWNHEGNASSVVTPDANELYSVESRLTLPKGFDTKSVRCIVRHPCWELERIFVLHDIAPVPWLLILTVVIITGLLAGLLFILQKKLRILRQCQQLEHSNSPSKPPPTEDVEEVEPYASYVQRVNSIYNSSADLFT
ncbi:cell surface glycoprotein CD200 receptor 1-A-like isoform X2 [Cheilinus undulatus]|uniref:cell surface glycoprotein CD200 receptor 1-A-like isoform X2 n=1 Tax=Cheilinus undulatus TaxID=241271 RepID=UPI001BD5D003|nr:cell surface glycoprotein CD200 receptor 1-A-like isoform X2 [Cheilinus undulatus]